MNRLTLLFHQGIFDQKQHGALLVTVSPIDDKTQRPPFCTSEVMEAEL
jgi:hypothetical protein